MEWIALGLFILAFLVWVFLTSDTGMDYLIKRDHTKPTDKDVK